MVEFEQWDGRLEDSANALLFAPANETDDDEACASLVEQSVEDLSANLLITFERSSRDRLAKWNTHTNCSNAHTRVISIGELTRSAASETASASPFLPRIDTVAEPTDLGSLGRCISAHLEALEVDSGVPVVCFHSLHTVLQHNDVEDVFRFLHLLIARIEAVGAVAHYHLDPSQIDWRDTLPLLELFDALIAVNPDDRFTPYRSKLGLDPSNTVHHPEQDIEDELVDEGVSKASEETTTSENILDSVETVTPWIWMVAILTYGIGDIATTLIGIQMGIAIEASPMSAWLIEQYELGVIYPIKVATFVLFYFLWWLSPSPYNVGVPIGLALIGSVVTVWNLSILMAGGLL